MRYKSREGQLPRYGGPEWIHPDDPNDPCRECDGFMDEECYNCDKAASFWPSGDITGNVLPR